MPRSTMSQGSLRDVGPTLAVAVTGLSVLLASRAAWAQSSPPPDANGLTNPTIATSLPYDSIRKQLADHGLTYYFIYTNDVLSDLSGGNKRGTSTRAS